MTKQAIEGNENQQANGDIYNHYLNTSAVACISNAQARQLRWLVETIESLLNSYNKPISAAEIWANLHDYCHTPALLPNESRSQYRLMPATTFHRAKCYLLEKLWVARMTGKSKRKVKLYSNDVSSGSDDNYEDDADPHVVQRYFSKCDEVDVLKQQIETLKLKHINELQGQEVELMCKVDELKSQLKAVQTTNYPKQDPHTPCDISEIRIWDCVSGGDYSATVTHDGENDSQSVTNIKLVIGPLNGIEITHTRIKDGGHILHFDMLGSAERRSLCQLLDVTANELKKSKKDLGGNYSCDDEGWDSEEYNALIHDYEQAITNSENGD
jgi:hypothetical protein